MKLKIYITLFLLTVISSLHAQVGIGTTTPATSSALDITSTNTGLLIPRVALISTSDVATIASPVTSLLVYNSGFPPNGYYYWNGTLWVLLSTGNNTDWSLTGNSGTSSLTNFLGTTDDIDIVFKRFNVRAAFLGNPNTTSGNMNTSFGANSLLNPSGTRNVTFGTNVLPSNTTGNRNTSVGERSMFTNTIGSNNTAVGSSALAANTTATGNTAVGSSALAANTTATGNTAVGSSALAANTTATGNTAVGSSALSLNTATNNTAVGTSALAANTTSGDNTAIGFNALTLNTGANNTALGAGALDSNTGGQSNTAVGSQALGGINTAASQDNTAVGFRAFALGASANITRSTGIGAYAMENSTAGSSTALGYGALRGANGVNLGVSNVAIGIEALRFNTTGTNNTVIGSNAGSSTSTGSFNVFLGNSAGSSEAGNSSNKLYIENSNADQNAALIYGEFDNNIIRVNGTLQISNPASAPGYSLPNVRGTAGQVLQTNGVGGTSWALPNNTLSVVRTNLSANQSLGTSGWQKLSFNTVVFDSNSEFFIGTNRFVAAKTGYYEINAGFHTFNQSDLNYYGIAVYKNGAIYQETSAHHYGINLISRTINCLISLTAGDYIEIYAHNTNIGTTIDGYIGKTYFEVKQIR
jgi:hypothetical protein